MFDYQTIFEQRGNLYNRATRACPDARAQERQLLLERLALRAGLTVCDAPAGGGYVAEGLALRNGIDVICVEPSRAFAGDIDRRFPTVVSALDDIALPPAAVDRVASLAGLHHLPRKDAFFREAARILRRGGRIAVADVLVDTPPALFLNGTVHRLSETGHQGTFLAPGELTRLLEDAGFVDVREEHCEYTWRFPDAATMVAYCADLFGLTRAEPDELLTEIECGPGVIRSATDLGMRWSLVYASGVLPRTRGAVSCRPTPPGASAV
jgi:SAM-dependent methyltransferase